MSKGFLHSLKNIAGKHGQDTRMRFSVAPLPGDSGFTQWHDAMMMCARLPGGIPQEFRRRLWLTLAEKHLQARGINWAHAEGFCFNEWSNPDDDELGDQIVKDLHRTGCSLFCGEEAEDNQAMLKRVLLAFARWNKGVGYCQGFNMLAAIILEVMERQESDALKVMIYLIEGVLPESYFANNLRGLSVDMAVFRDLLRLRLPQLSRHLEHLQHDAADLATGTSYEPPLTNVFTMQWFLTLFSNCLPRETVMRVWDLTFLQGDEVLLRTALAIWDGLAGRILEVHSADEFYTVMGVLTREMLTFGLMDANKLVQTVVGMAPFPFPGLAELRDKYTYNITPWAQSVSSVAKRGLRLFYSDDDDDDNDEDDQKIAVATAFGLSGIFRKNMEVSRGPSPVGGGTAVSPSSFTPLAFPSPRHAHEGRETTRPNLDISALKKQYARLRERQKQAQIILTASQLRMSSTLAGGVSNTGAGIHKTTPLTMNHLLRGKKALTSKTRRVVPQGVIPVMKPKKKAERKLSDSTGTRSTPQQQKRPVTSTSSFRSPHQPMKQLPGGSQGPPKMETLHWKDTPRRDRRASLPSGVKLLEGATPSLGTLGVPSEVDDDDDGSSTSTELCDDEEEDKLSDLEADPATEPRPATTSPRLETVQEKGKTSPKPAQPQSVEQTQDKQKPVSQVPLPSVTPVQKSQAQESVPVQQKTDAFLNVDKTSQIPLPSEPQQQDFAIKEQESEVFLATEPPLWDFKSMETGIPLEDLLAGKNLTAAEIIARIPFPSDVSFMKQSSEGANQVQGSSSPSSIQHNVTPERSPVDSPLPKISSPNHAYEPVTSTKPSPNASPSKSLSSTPSPRGSPIKKSSRSPSKSPTLSPKQSQNHHGPAKWSLVGLPPVSPPDTSQDIPLIPPKSPKITVEDEKSNIFEIHTGRPGFVTSSIHPHDEKNDNVLEVGSSQGVTSVKNEIYPLPPISQDDLVDDVECKTFTREEKIVELKDIDLSVLPIKSSENLETVYEHPGDDMISPDSTNEDFIKLKEPYDEITKAGGDEPLVDTDLLRQKNIQTPESSMFDAICQKLKENVIKAESDNPELQTDFTTKSGLLCLTMDSKEDAPISEAKQRSYEEQLRIPDGDTEVAADFAATVAPEATVSSSSWLSSLTMNVNVDVIPSATSDGSLVTTAATSLEGEQAFVGTAVSMEVPPIKASVESSDSPGLVTSEAGPPSAFLSLESGFPAFAEVFKSETSITSVDGSDVGLLTGKIMSSFVAPPATTLNDRISFENTVMTDSISPITTFDSAVSPETSTKEFTFPCVCSGISAFTTTFDSENVVSAFDTSDIIPSIDYQSSPVPLNRYETKVSSPTATKAEHVSPIVLSVIGSPSASVTTPITITSHLSAYHRAVKFHTQKIMLTMKSSAVMCQEGSLKSITGNGISDFETPLEKEVLSLIGWDQAGEITPTLPEAVTATCESCETTELTSEIKLERELSPGPSLEERISALLNMDERAPSWTKLKGDLPEATTYDKLVSPTASLTMTSNLAVAAESEENGISSTETSVSHYSPPKATQEGVSSPISAADRDSSLSASLEGRISFFTNNINTEEEEEGGAYGRLTEDTEDKNSEDNEAETETDFFNGKDLSSEAIRQRLWRGVKSLSLDADITLDPDVFCFLIQQSSRHLRNSKDGERKMPKRRNSEVALQELVKENTEIIERILRQKSVEGTNLKKTDSPVNTPVVEAASEEELDKKTELPMRSHSLREKSESGHSANKQSHKITKSASSEVPTAAKFVSSEAPIVAISVSGDVPTASIHESHEQITGFSKDIEVSQAATKSKVISPQSSRTFTLEQKQGYKKDDSSIPRSPIRPITFNPFPTRNVTRQPKEVAVKLGLYSPTKKTSDSSPT
ncbi:LOW QUALITY PROTEIN: uncharacterized protein [Panulirus ornatus]|uniref:LOW QUALITY PROTEIN: uncharacterized protein n=1 Tax=Panulirus ornatus TaxID=150431 RepID=UPI003A8A4256